MSQILDEVYDVDRINAVCEQLAGFIMRKILDPRSKFYHDGHINRLCLHRRREGPNRLCPHRCHEGPSTCTINMTSIFVNICKCDVVLFVYL